MKKSLRNRSASAVALTAVAALALSACGSQDDDTDTGKATGGGTETTSDGTPAAEVDDALVVTYDGGLYVLDGSTLEIAADVELEGFNRVNPAGDDRHVMVSTASGFRVFDTAAQDFTEAEFPGEKPGHVVRHAGKTVLFVDGTGEVVVFDPADLADGTPEPSRTYTSPEPHHGVAIELENGELLTTLGDEESRVGLAVLGADDEELARNEDCPGVHGEAAAKDEAIVVGCQDGVLIYRDGEFTKVDSPDGYGRIGNQAGSEESAVLLGDYKSDPDAELERPERVSLIDTASGELRLVELGTSYSFRSLARGPHGEALVLGTDGAIHVIDPEQGEVTDTLPVVGEWQEPLDWQEARPTLFVRGHTAYVSEPAERALHAVDIESGETLASVTLPEAVNEVTGVVAGH
ncbi:MULTISPECIES: zinc metallochaperone AztD [unclassified Streptomyces]|uniref:zinc metallochaperone AztD n=1 Tax=unclassified Streptomyces TaxID=2593676 RepID=UPI000CD4DA82|nr:MULTISPECIES: zinc metallochaperone AztD [unclassified Streptomyces]